MRLSLHLALGAALLTAPPTITRAFAAPEKAPAKKTVVAKAKATIKVLSAEGKPVGDARLRIRPLGMRDEKDIIVARTDASGIAKIEVPIPGAKAEILGNVAAVAPGVGIGETALKSGENVVTLMKSATLGGRVVDENGKPLAGAAVAAGAVILGEGDGARYLSLAGFEDIFSAKTDAAGKWSLDGLPEDWRASVGLKDDGFARATTMGIAGKGDAPNLVARPGAVVEGVIVDEAGKPVAGVRVTAQSQNIWVPQKDTTDATGAFRIGSLPAGNYTLAATQSEQKFVAASVADVVLQAGASTHAPNIVMSEGALIEGDIKDESGKPAEGVSISVQAIPWNPGGYYSAQTDAAGHYRVRVSPGDLSLLCDNNPSDDFYSEGAGSSEQPISLSLKKGDLSQHDFTVKHAFTLSGVAVDENGKPVKGAKIVTSANPYYWPNIVSDEDGKWEVRGQKPGTLKIDVKDEWQLAAPQEVTLPRTEPLRLVLKSVPLQNVAGRVLTPDGKPVEGARVLAQLQEPILQSNGPAQSMQRQLEATSDAQGRFVFEKISARNTLQNAVAGHESFGFVSGGTATKNGDNWTMSDVVMQPLLAKVRGRVLAPDGKPAAGAWIGAEAGNAKLSQTDASGVFTLDGLPSGDVTLTAFSGALGARQKVVAQETDGAEVALQLQAPAPLMSGDIDRGFAILSRLIADTQGRNYGARSSLPDEIDPYDHDLATNLRQKVDAAAGTTEQFNAEMFPIVADTPRVLREKAALVARIEGLAQNTWRTFWRSRVALVLAGSDKALATELLHHSQADLAGFPQTIGEATLKADASTVALIYGATAALASRLDDPSAQELYDSAMIYVERIADIKKEDVAHIRSMVRELSVYGTREFFENAMRDAPPQEQVDALSNAIDETASSDLPFARSLFEKLEAANKNVGNVGNENTGYPADYAFGRAAGAIITRMKESDAAAALELARRIKNEQMRGMALAYAARLQPAESREALFREAMKAAVQPWDRTAGPASVAALAGETDAALGEKLLRELAAKSSEPPSDGYPASSSASLAFFLARYDAGAARLLLESEYSRMKSALPPNTYGLSSLALAMCALDFNRALEMARSLPEGDECYDTQRRIARYAMADEKARRTMFFGQ